MSIEVKDCVFSFTCPKSWDSLQVTDDPNVKYCESCKENVWFCRTNRALKEAVKRGKCVAIEVSPYDNLTGLFTERISLGRMEQLSDSEFSSFKCLPEFLRKRSNVE